MKFRSHSGGEKVELMMTPMIDIVFQLLAFFIMSFKLAAQEGDFNVKMPLAGAAPGISSSVLPPIKVRLTADAQGKLASLSLNETPLVSFKQLQNNLIQLVGTDRSPGSIADMAEVELDCDYDLRYEGVVNAVTHVSGYVADGGVIVKLVEKIKFSPPRQPRGE